MEKEDKGLISIEERVTKQMEKMLRGYKFPVRGTFNGPFDCGERELISAAAKLAYVYALADFRKEIIASVTELEFEVGGMAEAYPK